MVVANTDADKFLVRGNISYLVQAVQQIWENAIQHTPAGGTITVGLRRQDEQVVITIKDTGTGIGEEDLPRIFNRFFRTDRAGTARGFGLGLPITKAIVDLHGGSIEVESTPGQGTTFSILLPQA
jgi:signal transduction histidine kinase